MLTINTITKEQTNEKELKRLIGKRIKERRLAFRMSAEEVAELSGVSPSTVYRYEAGDMKKLDIVILKNVAKSLHTNISYLVGEAPEPTKIILSVEGGNVRKAFTNHDNTEITVYDIKTCSDIGLYRRRLNKEKEGLLAADKLYIDNAILTNIEVAFKQAYFGEIPEQDPCPIYIHYVNANEDHVLETTIPKYTGEEVKKYWDIIKAQFIIFWNKAYGNSLDTINSIDYIAVGTDINQ
ncbi:transcriptional regulator with XRE-family HTH domain [Lachnospiraceae bacterium PF1-22]